MRILILLLILAASPALADSVIEVETPAARHVYAGCAPEESHIARHGTTATIIAACAAIQSTTRPIGWQPDPHPDGYALRFESRLIVSLKSPSAFLACELTDYAVTPAGSSQRWQCLDDPIVMRRRGRP